jgi:hypothetical protein
MSGRGGGTVSDVQLDLFGAVEHAEQVTLDRVQALAEWQARFERAGQWGWVCPACGVTELNDLLLGSNHGYHPDQPGRGPYGAEFGVTCVRLELLAAHKVYDERRAMLRHLAAEGLTDEQIATRIGFWNVATIAGYRKDDKQAARLAARLAKGEIVKVPHGEGCPCAFCDGPCGCPSCDLFRRTGQCTPSDGPEPGAE